MTEVEQPQGNGRILEGRVVSSRMDKTVTVEVTRTVLHARYHKYVARTTTFKAHDEGNLYQENDLVVIQECRPLSKTKRWTVLGKKGEVAKAARGEGA